MDEKDKVYISQNYNDYFIWLEENLFRILKKNKVDMDIKSIENELDSCEKPSHELYDKQYWLEYFLKKNDHDYYEQFFLLNTNFMLNDTIVDLGARLLKSNEENILIDQKDEIIALKLFIAEFLIKSGYDQFCKYQEKLIKQKIQKVDEINGRKRFHNIEAVIGNGEKRNIIVYYTTLRGCTTWYAKHGLTSSKIKKNKNNDFIYMENGRQIKIIDTEVIDYISKDYD